jgi:hypothetical protein
MMIVVIINVVDKNFINISNETQIMLQKDKPHFFKEINMDFLFDIKIKAIIICVKHVKKRYEFTSYIL